MSNEIQEKAEAQTMNALTQAIASGQLQPEQLSMILDAQERILDRQAKQEFSAAMAACQSEIPGVLKNKYNEQTRSKFEDLESLNKTIVPIYTKHGFGVSFDTGDSGNPDTLRILADVSHKSGWTKQYHYDLAYDMYGIKGTVNKTKIHGSSSTVAYGRRYLLKMIFNITTSDEIDNDGNQPVELISVDQQTVINDLLNESKSDKDIFLKYIKCDSVENIPANKYARVLKVLEDKKNSAVNSHVHGESE